MDKQLVIDVGALIAWANIAIAVMNTVVGGLLIWRLVCLQKRWIILGNAMDQAHAFVSVWREICRLAWAMRGHPHLVSLYIVNEQGEHELVDIVEDDGQ